MPIFVSDVARQPSYILAYALMSTILFMVAATLTCKKEGQNALCLGLVR